MSKHVTDSFYDGSFSPMTDMVYINQAEAFDSLLKARDLLTTSSKPSEALKENGEQCFILANFWIKFVKGLGLTALAEHIAVSIIRDGFIQTIANCSSIADMIIGERGIPESLVPFVFDIPEDNRIKFLLQALRLPKRFSPIGADLLVSNALKAFQEKDSNLYPDDLEYADDPDTLFFAESSDGTTCISHKSSSVGLGCINYHNGSCKDSIYGDEVKSFRVNKDGSLSCFDRVIRKEFTEAINDLFSYTRKFHIDKQMRKIGKAGAIKETYVASKRKCREYFTATDLFPWTEAELSEAAIVDAVPSGAALDSCKNKVCKCLNAQTSGGRQYGDERCVPPYIRIDKGASAQHMRSLVLYQQALRSFTISPVKHDVVVVNGVPKTYKSPRIIAPEAVNNSIRAWMIERELRRMIQISDFKDEIIIDLQDTPTGGNEFANIQHARAADYKHWACFDFSAASDQIAKAEIKAVYPEWLSSLVMKGVSKFFTIDSNKKNPALYPLKTVSTMGNPITFRNMEIYIAGLCLLAIRMHNKFVEGRGKKVSEHAFSVYGDDVMIDIRVAETFIDICSAFGMTLNLTKSHWEKDDPYREACGREYWAGKDITSMYWPRRALTPNQTDESVNWFDGEDKSYWASILSLNNHVVDLVESKFGQDRLMMEACNFLHAYIKGEFPNARFTHPRAPWRKDGILLGYDPRVTLLELDSERRTKIEYRPVDTQYEKVKLDNGRFGYRTAEFEVVDWTGIVDYKSFAQVKDVSYIEAISLYDDPRIRYCVTRVGTVGEYVKDPKTIPGTKGTAYRCACMSTPEPVLAYYADTVLYAEYLAKGPSPLGTSDVESQLTTPRKIDRTVPVIGFVEDYV